MCDRHVVQLIGESPYWRYIVEATVKENYWGCGPNNDGQNNYGKIVMAVRLKLKIEYEGEIHHEKRTDFESWLS